jgi:hypothetical protein
MIAVTCLFPYLMYSIVKNSSFPSMFFMSAREGSPWSPSCKVICSGHLMCLSSSIALMYILLASVWRFGADGSTDAAGLIGVLHREILYMKIGVRNICVNMNVWMTEDYMFFPPCCSMCRVMGEASGLKVVYVFWYGQMNWYCWCSVI